MAPSLGIQYSSEGGSGWLGEGWSLSVPSISLDTRWGVPRYDMASETETYLLSGSMLSTMDEKGQMGVAHRGDKMPRKADRQFYTRQEETSAVSSARAAVRQTITGKSPTSRV